MGEIDIAKEAPNVTRMKLLGAKVVPVSFGGRAAPFPMMVRNFQSVVGHESREQFLELVGELPDEVGACVGGGSNAMGMFAGFIENQAVGLNGVEPLGRGTKLGEHSATMTYGEPGMIHGFKCLLLSDDEGNPAPVHSIASGLDYPGVGPEHSHLKVEGRVKYHGATDQETLDAFYELSRSEGIIPALESAHAVAWAMRHGRDNPGSTILINLSGRGDKDIDYVTENFGFASQS